MGRTKRDRRTLPRGANALHRARLAAGLTYKQLGALLGMDAGNVCNMEVGVSPIGPRRAARLALALGVAAQELLG